MPGKENNSETSEKPVETTNDNFETNVDTQHIVISMENAKVEEKEEDEKIENVEKTPSHASFEIIPEQNNKQEDDDTTSASDQNSNENQESQKNDEIEADEK